MNERSKQARQAILFIFHFFIHTQSPCEIKRREVNWILTKKLECFCWSRRDQEGGGAGPSRDSRKDQEEGGGAGPSRDSRKDQEEGGGAGPSRDSRKDQEEGGGAGPSRDSRKDQEEGGGAGPSRDPRRDQEQGGGAAGFRKMDLFCFSCSSTAVLRTLSS